VVRRGLQQRRGEEAREDGVDPASDSQETGPRAVFAPTTAVCRVARRSRRRSAWNGGTPFRLRAEAGSVESSNPMSVGIVIAQARWDAVDRNRSIHRPQSRSLRRVGVAASGLEKIVVQSARA
jgi:hypothetical protein